MDLGTLGKATTQYDDLVGTAAFDFRGQMDDLDRFARDCGIDTKIYSPEGMYISMSRNFSLEIFCAKRSDYPIEKGKKRPLVSVHVNCTREDFFKHAHRFRVILHSKFHATEEYEIVESVHIDDLNSKE